MINELVAKEKENIIAWRRQIHKNPELGFQEHKTGALVADLLTEFGYKVEKGVGGTGVVGVLEPETGSEKKAVALRADIDALPITEENDLTYASQNLGAMHACGHDGHTAMLLGAAKVLAQLQEELAAPLVVLFQPAEERLGGAIKVLESGFLERYRVGEIFGLHLWPQLPLGKVGLKEGPVMAGSINFKIKLLGRHAHAAEPHNAKDAIVAGAAIVGALQAIPSRFINPLDAVVVSVGTFHAGEISNIIPGKAELTGTARTASPAVYQALPELITQVVENTTRTYGLECELDVVKGYPVTVSHRDSVALVDAAVKEQFGEEQIEPLSHSFMNSEDFCYYLEKIPGAYFFLGIGPERNLHQPTFDFEESILPLGSELLARVALKASQRQDLVTDCRK